MKLLEVDQLNLDNHNCIAIVGKRETGKTVLADYLKTQQPDKVIPSMAKRIKILECQTALTHPPDVRKTMSLMFIFAVTGTIETHRLHENFCPSVELMEFRGMLNELEAYEALVIENGTVLGKFKAPLVNDCDRKNWMAVVIGNGNTFGVQKYPFNQNDTQSCNSDDFDKCSVDETKSQEENLDVRNELENKLNNLMKKFKESHFPYSKEEGKSLEDLLKYVYGDPPINVEPVCVKGVQLGFNECSMDETKLKMQEMQGATIELENLMRKFKDNNFPLSKERKTSLEDMIQDLKKRSKDMIPLDDPRQGDQLGFDECSEPQKDCKDLKPVEFQGQEFASLADDEKVYQNQQEHFKPLEGLEPTSDKPDSNLRYEFKPMQPIEKKQSGLLKKSGILIGGSDEWTNAVLNPPNEKSDETETENVSGCDAYSSTLAPCNTEFELNDKNIKIDHKDNVWTFSTISAGGLDLRQDLCSLVIRENTIAGQEMLVINEICFSKRLLQFIETIQSCDCPRGVIISFRDNPMTLKISRTNVELLSYALEIVTKPKETSKVDEELLPYGNPVGAPFNYEQKGLEFLYGEEKPKPKINQHSVLPPLRPKPANQGMPPPQSLDAVRKQRQTELKDGNKDWAKFL